MVCKVHATPKQWRSSNKFKDLVDYSCRLGVKQRVFLHVNGDVDTLGRHDRLKMLFGKILFL